MFNFCIDSKQFEYNTSYLRKEGGASQTEQGFPVLSGPRTRSGAHEHVGDANCKNVCNLV